MKKVQKKIQKKELVEQIIFPIMESMGLALRNYDYGV